MQTIKILLILTSILKLNFFFVNSAPVDLESSSDLISTEPESEFDLIDVSSFTNSNDDLEDDADLFVAYFNEQLQQHYNNIETFELDRAALTWDFVNMFFSATGAMEGCSFPASAPVATHKHIMCGLGVAGITFNFAAIFINVFDDVFGGNSNELKYFMTNLGFTVPGYDNDYFVTSSEISSFRENYSELFKQIDKFRETETFSRFANMGFKINVETKPQVQNDHSYTDYLISLDTNSGIGAYHGLKLKVNANQYMLRMMANSRYVNMPTKIIKAIYKIAKENRQMIKDGEIKDFIISVMQIAGDQSGPYFDRMKSLFTALGKQDISSECLKQRYGFKIQDPKQDDMTVMKVSAHIKC